MYYNFFIQQSKNTFYCLTFYLLGGWEAYIWAPQYFSFRERIICFCRMATTAESHLKFLFTPSRRPSDCSIPKCDFGFCTGVCQWWCKTEVSPIIIYICFILLFTKYFSNPHMWFGSCFTLRVSHTEWSRLPGSIEM